MSRDAALFVTLFAAACAIIAADCLRASLMGGIPMPPETHGTAMYAIPGWLWSGVSLALALSIAVSAQFRLYLPLAWAAVLSGIVNISLAVFAVEAPMGFITSRIAFGVGLIDLCVAGMALAYEFGVRARRCLDEVKAALDKLIE